VGSCPGRCLDDQVSFQKSGTLQHTVQSIGAAGLEDGLRIESDTFINDLDVQLFFVGPDTYRYLVGVGMPGDVG